MEIDPTSEPLRVNSRLPSVLSAVALAKAEALVKKGPFAVRIKSKFHMANQHRLEHRMFQFFDVWVLAFAIFNYLSASICGFQKNCYV
jgi:hypothetical protein